MSNEKRIEIDMALVALSKSRPQPLLRYLKNRR